MTETIKMRLARRVMDVIRRLDGDPSMDRTRCETALRRRGMKNGNAQRLLDDTSDVQLKRIAEAARMLGVKPSELLQDSVQVVEQCSSIEPLGLEAALEVLGIALAREMPADVREDVADALGKLASRKGQDRDQKQVLSLLTDASSRKAQQAA